MVGYGTIYRFEFDGTCKPFNNQPLLVTKCKVLIQKKGYSGGITDIPYGQVTPVEIDYPTADDDIFYPIRGSVLSFKVLGGAINMDSIISEDETEYVLEYYRDNELFWTGFVSPELCEEDIFLKYPAIEFKTVDALGSLGAFNLKDSDGLKSFGVRSINNIIYAIFNGIGFNYKFNTLVKVWADGMSKLSDPFLQALSFLSSFRNKDGTNFSSIQILKSFAYLFNAIVYQDKGQWWFVKLKDLAFNQNSAFRYTSLNVADGTQSIPTLVHGTDFLIVAEPKRKIRRFYKQASVNYQFQSNFANLDPNFTIFDNDEVGNRVRIYGLEYKVLDPPYSQYNGVDVTEGYQFNLIRSGTREPDYKVFTQTNLICVPYFDDRINDYGVVIGKRGIGIDPGGYLTYTYGYVTIVDNINISLSSVTRNGSIKIIVEYGTTLYYYDDVTNEWSTTDTMCFIFDPTTFECPPPPVNGTLSIRFYYSIPNGYQIDVPNVDIDGTRASCYHGFYVNAKKVFNNELITVTNTKNTSIIPDEVIVNSGDPTISGDSLFVYDDSNLLLTLEPLAYTKDWVERNEDTAYKIQELSARNILNQYSDYRTIFTGTIIGRNLRFGAIYEFPIQGALSNKKFFPLSIKLNERDCTADVVFMELSPNEIDGVVNDTIFDTDGNIVYQGLTSSKKKIVMG